MGCCEWLIYFCVRMCYCMYVWFVVSLYQAVSGYALVWPVIRGVTLSDHGMATGFGPFNLPTCGPLPKGRDHSHVESGKHIYKIMSVLFVVFLSFIVYLFSRIKLW